MPNNNNVSVIISRKETTEGGWETDVTTITFPSKWEVVQTENWQVLDFEGWVKKEVKTPDGKVVFTRTEAFGYQAGDGSSEWGYEEEVTGNISAASILRWAKSRFPEYIKGEKTF